MLKYIVVCTILLLIVLYLACIVRRDNVLRILEKIENAIMHGDFDSGTKSQCKTIHDLRNRKSRSIKIVDDLMGCGYKKTADTYLQYGRAMGLKQYIELAKLYDDLAGEIQKKEFRNSENIRKGITKNVSLGCCPSRRCYRCNSHNSILHK